MQLLAGMQGNTCFIGSLFKTNSRTPSIEYMDVTSGIFVIRSDLTLVSESFGIAKPGSE